MRLIFLGSVIFSKFILKRLIKTKYSIVGVIGKKSPKMNNDFFDITHIAKSKKIPSMKTDDINDEKAIKWIKRKKPDLIICVGWSKILSSRVLKIPKHCVIGYHPSDLPLNRGKHPIIWSLALGLKKIGSTFFIMDNSIDNGKIISKKIIEIKKNHNATMIYKRLQSIASNQLLRLIKQFSKNKKFKIIKKKSNKSNYWRKRDFKDGVIDWRMNSETIQNLVKALNDPYPGAVFSYKGKFIRVDEIKIKVLNIKNIEPGKVISIINKKPLIQTGSDAILLKKYYPRINFRKEEYL